MNRTRNQKRIVQFAIAGAVIAALAATPGCLTLKLGAEPPPRAFVAPSSPGVPLQVTPLQLGHNQAPRCGPAGGASCFSSIPIFIGAYLVKHPKGTFLIDSGVAHDGKEDSARFGFFAKQAVDYTPDQTLQEALAKAGTDPAAVQFVVLTHAHWDHAGGLVDLPKPRVLLGDGEREFIASFPRKDAEPLVVPRHFTDARFETVNWDGPAYSGFEKSHDLFGDGSVVLVPLAGHTPGSLGVFLNSVGGRRLLFIGDAAWSREAVTLPSHKLRPMSQLTDDDPDKVSDTLWRLHQLTEQDPSLLLVPAHDGEVMKEVAALAK